MTGFQWQRRKGGLSRSLRAALAGATPLCFILGGPLAAAPVAANCVALADAFDAAANASRDKDTKAAMDKAAAEPACAAEHAQMQRRFAGLRLTYAQQMMAQGKPLAAYESALAAAEKPHLLWQASAALGEARFNARAFAEAAQAFDRAIEIVKNETLTPAAPQPDEIQRLMDRGAQARLLAANQQPGKGGKGEFVRTAANAGGGLGGVYSPTVRGIVPRAVLAPITFDYRSAELTPVGLAAAKELARALQEQQLQKIRVIGHTDPRGGPEFNLKLSKDRAEAVAAFLRQNGVSAAIETEGRGAAEPLQVDASAGLSPDDLNALNRRVEWRRE